MFSIDGFVVLDQKKIIFISFFTLHDFTFFHKNLLYKTTHGILKKKWRCCNEVFELRGTRKEVCFTVLFPSAEIASYLSFRVLRHVDNLFDAIPGKPRKSISDTERQGNLHSFQLMFNGFHWLTCEIFFFVGKITQMKQYWTSFLARELDFICFSPKKSTTTSHSRPSKIVFESSAPCFGFRQLCYKNCNIGDRGSFRKYKTRRIVWGDDYDFWIQTAKL